MKLTWEPLTLTLKVPFRIAHGVSNQRHNVLVCLDDGYGEAPAVPYYNETPEGIMAYLATLPQELGDDPFDIEAVLNLLPQRGSLAARAAVDIALHDLWGKQIGQPLYRLLGLNPQRMPLTSFTIAIDEPEAMAQRAKECGYPILKVKLGSDNDEAIIAAIRNATSAKLRLDANAGWTREQALDLIPRLAQYDIEFIEQPLATDDVEGLRWLHSQLKAKGIKVPIFADESARTSKDVAKLIGAVDGIVVKLMKTGGIREAVRTIHTAHALDMQVMVSCMVESAVGVTAAAHIAPMCEYADLDGPLLVANDPFRGITYDNARMILPNSPGLGVERI